MAFFVLIIIAIVVVSIIIPLVNFSRIQSLKEYQRFLENRIKELSREIKYLKKENQNNFIQPESDVIEEQEESGAIEIDELADDVTEKLSNEKPIEVLEKVHEISVENTVYEIIDNQKPQEKQTFESQFSGKIGVWIGAVALIFSVFYLVKYSIQNGFFTPFVQMISAFLLSFFMHGLGYFLSFKFKEQSKKASQALIGSSMASLYLTLFGSSLYYQLLPEGIAYSGMVLATLYTMFLSTKFGAPIAVLALITGFITPALFESYQHPALTYSYVFGLFCAFIYLIKKEKWWWLSIPVLCAEFLWILKWVLDGFPAGDGLFVQFFLLATHMLLVSPLMNDYGELDENQTHIKKIFEHFGIDGSLGLMGIISLNIQHDLWTWVMMVVMVMSYIYLSIKRPKTFSWSIWYSMVFVGTVYLNSPPEYPIVFLCIFIGIYKCYAVYCLLRKEFLCSVKVWSLVQYIFLGVFYFSVYQGEIKEWGGYLLILTFINGVFIYLKQHLERTQESVDSDSLMFLTLIVTVDIACFCLLPIQYLMPVYAIILLLCSRIRILDIPHFHIFCMGQFIISALCYLPFFGFVLDLIVISFVGEPLLGNHPESFLLVKHPVLLLLIPTLCYFLSSVQLRKESDSILVKVLEWFACPMLAFSFFLMYKNFMELPLIGEKSSFLKRGVKTNLILLYGLLVSYSAVKFNRVHLITLGTIFVGVGLFRIFYLDLLTSSPIIHSHSVGSIPLFNGVMLNFALPMLLLWYYAFLFFTDKVTLLNFSKCISVILLLVFSLLEVRSFFHGNILNSKEIFPIEMWVYSLNLLLIGVSLLWVGMKWFDSIIRKLALVIIVISICKVFLIDARHLEGLMRVVSFFALGMTLILLSLAYQYLSKKYLEFDK